VLPLLPLWFLSEVYFNERDRQWWQGEVDFGDNGDDDGDDGDADDDFFQIDTDKD